MASDVSSNELLEWIADERRHLADTLEVFTPDQWNHPSLCDGWTNRHVAAHLTMGFDVPMPMFVLRMIKARGDFNRAANDFANEKVKAGTDELVGSLRKNASHKFKPPGADYGAPLTDVMLHGVDIRRPLGLVRPTIDPTLEAKRWRVVLDTISPTKIQKFFKNDVSGVKLEATDLDWTLGSGPSVRGSAEDLALLVSRRVKSDAGFAQLSGDGVSVLKART
jgi:uncharacterized protein (TIGR03083 family)